CARARRGQVLRRPDPGRAGEGPWHLARHRVISDQPRSGAIPRRGYAMSDSERFDDVTHQLVTGLDEIQVPPAVLRATAPRRGFSLVAIAATAVVVVAALALGSALRPADNGSAAPAAVTSRTSTPAQSATCTR